jgi:peptidyl-prolyl cis-trans isomerase C
LKKILVALFIAFIGLSGCTKGDEKGAVPEASGNNEATGSTQQADYIAKVGDELITKGDIELILSQIPMQYRARYSSAEGRRELVDALVGMKMFAWEAKKRGIDKKSDVQLKIGYIIDQTLARELEEELQSSVKVEDKDIENYYKENQDQYMTPEKVKARHILVDSEEEAVQILEKIKSGADFAELAREKSKCPSSSKGGDLGWFGKGKMDPAFEKASFELKKDEVSGVVKSTFGYHIIRVDDKRPAKTKTLDQASRTIERTMKNDLLEKQMTDLKDQIKKEIKVVVREEYFTSYEDNKPAFGKSAQEGDNTANNQGE